MLLVDRELVERVRGAQAGTELLGVVQSAVELEHATIPPYLTAYYTLRPGRNDEIATAVRAVAVEEMLHMTIAGNLLLALGGRPRIAFPEFVPPYPTTLPLNLGESVKVPIAAFSRGLVHDVFMRIEEPAHPLEFPTRAVEAVAGPPPATIGEFYAALTEKIVDLGDAAFVGDPARQVVDNAWFPADQLFPLVDVDSAASALTMIAEEGEGTSSSPLDQEGELAHFYRFAELWHGHRLVPDADAEHGYSYTGSRIDFDPAGVWPMPANPHLSDYPADTRPRLVATRFTDSYTRLLTALQETFDGRRENLDTAIGLMFEMRLLALEVLATPDEHGRPTGLCFQFGTNVA